MSDLDPNFFLPLWRELVRYFRHYRPLVQVKQGLAAPSSTCPEIGDRGENP